MNWNASVILGLCGLSLLAGCATVDPLSLEVTPADREVYVDANAPRHEKRQFLVRVRSLADKDKSNPEMEAIVSKSAKSSVMKHFSNLGWFKTIDDENGIAIEEQDDGGSGIAYLLTMKSSIAYPAKHFQWHEFWGSGRYTYSADKARGADVTTDFSFVDTRTHKALLSSRFRSRRLCSSAYTVPKAVDAATDGNVRKLATVVASRLLPPVQVLETRGNGRCARVKMGDNYMVGPETDESPATVVEFFTFEKSVEKDANGKEIIEKVPFARGKVIRTINARESWVEVENWKTAGVRKGHFVRISDESIREATKDEFNGRE